MSEKIKNYVGWALIFMLVIGGFSVWSFASSYSNAQSPASFRSFEVSGEGKVVAIPDVAEFSFSVVNEGGVNLALLQKENTTRTNNAIAFLKEKRIDAKDIMTTGYQVSPRYEYANCGFSGGSVCPPPKIVGYTVTNTVRVKVRDFTLVGDVLAGVVEKGVNTVSSLAFTIDDPTTSEMEARNEAMQKAQEKAESLARAGHFRLGKILGIQESGNFPRPYAMAESFSVAGGDMKSSPTIEAGSQDVSVNLTVRYEIK